MTIVGGGWRRRRLRWRAIVMAARGLARGDPEHQSRRNGHRKANCRKGIDALATARSEKGAFVMK
ncbi:MAG: hypothetical protein LC634_05455, partial [Sphingomonadales bacterium]|nr:hypothetical protein [Sphingomonadales bacterium]